MRKRRGAARCSERRLGFYRRASGGRRGSEMDVSHKSLCKAPQKQRPPGPPGVTGTTAGGATTGKTACPRSSRCHRGTWAVAVNLEAPSASYSSWTVSPWLLMTVPRCPPCHGGTGQRGAILIEEPCLQPDPLSPSSATRTGTHRDGLCATTSQRQVSPSCGGDTSTPWGPAENFTISGLSNKSSCIASLTPSSRIQVHSCRAVVIIY
ncbi:uncharacterized protein LOC125691806 [Lagopus muta]|uniref:uncharacterized protein LOC125691806 n=1 Tax=Lagopus muta TaxID=64668 RepID=UPI00209DCB8A|nr:uncharacterized protein LOC125691806 [Lagopus muta]